MSEVGLLVIALATFAFALVARRLAEGVVTGPLAFLALGWGLASFGLLGDLGVEGGHGGGHVGGHGGGGHGAAEVALHVVAEATLVIVLFSDAAMTDVAALRRRFGWPARMLLIGLPVAVAFNFLVAAPLLTGWTWIEAALIAAILTPTDAALGQAVIANRHAPERTRRALLVESGLNDGLALPVVLFFGCLAVGGAHDGVQVGWVEFAARQIGLGVLIGGAVGYLGALIAREAAARGFADDAFESVAALALAALCYLVAVSLSGNGFLAAFVGGLAYGHVMRDRCAFVFEFMEAEGQALILLAFMLIGAVLLPAAIAQAEPHWVALILASLFIARPLAIGLALWRSGADPVTKGFLGWFGPRGLATALFALVVVGEFDALARADDIVAIATLAVAISAVLHGVTAAPGARWYARRVGGGRGQE